MANNIKGITIEIGGDTSELDRALKTVDSETRSLSQELRQINTQLKFDPQNTVLLEQKFKVLSEQVDKTREKLKTLEDAQEQVEEQYKNGEIDDGQYRAFQRELEKTKSQLEDLEGQQEAAEDAFKRAELSEKYEELQQQIDDTKSNLEDLQAQQEQLDSADIDTSAYEDLQQQIEAASAELENLQSEADSVSGQLDELNANADTTGESIGKMGDDASKAGGEMGEAGGTSGVLSDALGKAASQAGALGGAIGGALSGGMSGLIDLAMQAAEMIIEMAKAFDEANSTIVEKTGASGEALEEFNRIAAETAIAIDGLDVAGTAGVVGELATRLDLTGDALETATVLVGKFADITGTDAEQAVVNVSKVMKNWGVETEDMEGLLDKFTVASQKSGISVDTLAQDLVTHKAQLQEMGYGLDEAIAMLSNFEKESINSSKVLTGFNTAIGKWAKEGVNARDGFDQLSLSIQRASSSTEAITIATEYFGKKPAQELVYAIRSGRFEFDEFTGALDTSQGALLDTEERSKTFSENMENLGDTIMAFQAEGGPIGAIIDAANNTGTFGTAINNAATEMLGLNDAAQANVEMTPEMIEAQALEEEQLRKQAELESLAAGGYDQMSTNMDSIAEKIKSLNEEYEANYQNAYDNINKQIGLFEDMTTESGKSIDEMIGSLDSQIKYMDNYARNMKRAAELGIDEGLLAKLSDGSKESAQILQTIVDDGGEHVEELNTKLGLVEEGKKTFADTYATMQTDFDTQMGQIETRMKLAVDRMDQYDDAYKNGSDTVQGFIKGSQSHYREIYNAYEKVAKEANRAVRNNLKIQSPSKVMMQLGEYTVEGFAIGSLDELSAVENAYDKVAQAALEPFPTTATIEAAGGTTNVGGINITAPIQVVKELNDSEIQRVGGRLTDIVSREFARTAGGRL